MTEKPATVVFCIAHFQFHRANMLPVALSGAGGSVTATSESTGLLACERMSQGATFNLLTRSDATFREAMAGAPPNL